VPRSTGLSFNPQLGRECLTENKPRLKHDVHAQGSHQCPIGLGTTLVEERSADLEGTLRKFRGPGQYNKTVDEKTHWKSQTIKEEKCPRYLKG
jgi:hypothetical protein